MWKDKVKHRYRWAGIQDKFDELIFELTKAEEEEEAALYLLRLHVENEIDLSFFTEREKEKVKRLLRFLIKDTARHRDSIAKVIAELKNKRQPHAG